MALKAGRVGINKELVDEFGYLKEDLPTGEYYTKTQTDNKFETKTHAGNTYQKKTLELPLETLMGSKLTVEDSLDALNEIQKTRQPKTLELPLETLMGSKLTVEDSLYALNEIQKTRQPMTLTLPIETLSGTQLTVENALNAINDDVSEVVVSEAVTTEFNIESGYDKVRKIGRFKVADLTFRNVTITAWDQIGVIPEGFRPEIGVKGVTQGRQPFFIGTNGAITCGSDVADGVCAIHVVYL